MLLGCVNKMVDLVEDVRRDKSRVRKREDFVEVMGEVEIVEEGIGEMMRDVRVVIFVLVVRMERRVGCREIGGGRGDMKIRERRRDVKEGGGGMNRRVVE